jgi:hypothetical protein
VPISTTWRAISSREFDPVCRTHARSSKGSITPDVAVIRSVAASAGRCRVRRARCRYAFVDTPHVSFIAVRRAARDLGRHQRLGKHLDHPGRQVEVLAHEPSSIDRVGDALRTTPLDST